MDFAFLVHSRDYTDVQRKFKIAKYLPRQLIEFWCLNWPPIVVSKITGLKDINTGQDIGGHIIGIPMTAHQMMEHRELARKRVMQAIKKAEKLGARIVGLGALTSSVTNGGELIKNGVNIDITSGHAYTAYVVTSYVLKAIEEFSFNKEYVRIAVVGAAGSIGSTCAQILVHRKINKILLVDLERKIDPLKRLLQKLNGPFPDPDIRLSHRINDIKEADIVIAATNAPEALIRPDDLKSGAIVVDDAQPSDISPEVAKQRDDVLIIDAGVVTMPGINLHFNMGLADQEDIYSCLGEVLIMAATSENFKYKIHEVDISLIEKIGKTGKLLGLEIRNYQRFGRIYSEIQIDKTRRIIKEHKEGI